MQRSGSVLSNSKITSSAASSKGSADSTVLIEPDTADMYDRDTCWERDTNSQKKSRKTSKISRDYFKHHKRTSPTTKSSTSLLHQYYHDQIDQFEAENWRISARLHFEKLYKTLMLLQEMDSKDITFQKYISWTTPRIGVILEKRHSTNRLIIW